MLSNYFAKTRVNKEFYDPILHDDLIFSFLLLLFYLYFLSAGSSADHSNAALCCSHPSLLESHSTSITYTRLVVALNLNLFSTCML